MNYADNEPEPEELKPNSPEWIRERLRRFNISSLNHTFEKFKVDANTKEAWDTMKSLSEGKLNKQFVLLYGTTGCGKTHLIESTIINWTKHELFSRYMTFSEIARNLKSALRQGGEFYEQLFSRYKDATRLIVDDFGSGTTESRFEISDLEDIIDLRYRRRYYPDCDLTTILATNKDVRDLPDRVVSRFFDPEFGAVLYMGSRDYRRRKLK
jgi:DNA replication protein DnaC